MAAAAKTTTNDTGAAPAAAPDAGAEVEKVAGEVLPDLTAAERKQLAKDERLIERSLSTFLDVGRALADIRDARLYRATHPTFAAYLRERWDIADTWGVRLMSAARTVAAIEAGNEISGASAPPMFPSAAAVEPLAQVRAEARRTAGLKDGRGGDRREGGIVEEPDTPEVQAHVAAAWHVVHQRLQHPDSADGPGRITEAAVREALIAEGMLPDTRVNSGGGASAAERLGQIGDYCRLIEKQLDRIETSRREVKGGKLVPMVDPETKTDRVREQAWRDIERLRAYADRIEALAS